MYAMHTFKSTGSGTRRVLVVVGHPAPASLNQALAEAYAEGARQSGAEVVVIQPATFAMDVLADPRTVAQLEPDLVAAQDLIHAADHIAFVYPLWWGAAPVPLKAFIDRAFITGFAYQNTGKALPKPLLKGRTARIVLTMDAPTWWHRWMYRNSGVTWLKWATLWYTGIRTLGISVVEKVRTLKPEQVAEQIRRVQTLGERDGQRR
jgi:putative NADPH-quinone reductase